MTWELSDRSRQILFAVVTEYITSGKPVSSTTIARRYGVALSPATIRNVLADLVEAGFVHQPHTSAGRVPTDVGFRYFVDAMAVAQDISKTHREAVLSRLRALEPHADVMRETGQLLSSLTGTATVITTAGTAGAVLDQLRFIRLRQRQILVVLVQRSGTIENRVIPLAHDIGDGELERINNYVHELVSGRTLDDLRNTLAARVETERGRYELLRKQARQMVEAAVQSADNHGGVLIEGQGELFNRPEFTDPEKLRRYLSTFEDKERLLKLLDHTLDAKGVSVLIGAETNLDDIDDISVISSSYGAEGTTAGTVGIVGPTRMDYPRFVPLVGFTAKVLSDLLRGRGLKGPSDDHE